MTTELAIAAVKAQALWDAGEQLRRQAAEMHPEFARMLAAEKGDVPYDKAEAAENPCLDRGPRVGADGTRCMLVKGHAGRHRAHESFGDVQWSEIAEREQS